jgi:type VI secretion system secreted protein Hcp
LATKPLATKPLVAEPLAAKPLVAEPLVAKPLPAEAVGMVATPLPQMQPVAPAAAPKNYTFARMLVSVAGSKQKFHADSEAKNLDSHQFAAVELDFGLRTPIDAASGQRSGKHQHDPVVLIKELGPSTPQFFAALVDNETLTSVVCDCYGVEKAGGKEELYFTIKLSNASVASTQVQKPNNKYPDLMKVPDLQRISFTYEKIEWAWKNGASASDDWQERN